MGNRGNVYRNDGVDIFRDSTHYESYYVGSIEGGEWLQYSVNVKEKGTYAFELFVAATNEGGNVAISMDGKPVFAGLSVTATGSLKEWRSQPLGNVVLEKGGHTIRVFVNKGGCNFKQLLIKKGRTER